MTEERIPRLLPADLASSQRRLYDAVTSGDRARHSQILPLMDAHGSLEGPFGPLLHAPNLGLLTQALGAGIRSGLRVDHRTREIATLWCAVLAGSAYEIVAHRRLGMHAGLLPAEIDSLVAGTLPESLNERERAFASSAARVRWDDESFVDAQRFLRTDELVEAIVLGGYYRLLATLLDAFDITEVHD